MELFLLAIALAMDSVAISIANGAKCAKMSVWTIFKMSFIYGAAQGIMPILGFVLGLGFVQFVSSFDHFIIFAILLVLGVKMIIDSKNAPNQCNINLSLKILILGALATSIDALSIGVAFSFDEGFDIVFAACVIAGVCFVMCVAASYIGKFLGDRLQRGALVLVGAILILIGIKTLILHLFFAC